MSKNLLAGSQVLQLELTDDVYTDIHGVAMALGYDSAQQVTRGFARRGLAKVVTVEVDGKVKRLFPIETILTLAFLSDNAERAAEWKNLASDAVNDVMRYGFYIDPSLSTAPEIKIAIIEHVTRKGYVELARSRFKPSEKFYGSMLRGAYLTPTLLKRPESYLHAHEVKQVRAIEAAASLLQATMEVEPTNLLRALAIEPMKEIKDFVWARWCKEVDDAIEGDERVNELTHSITVRPDTPADEPGLHYAHLPTVPDSACLEQLYLERDINLDLPTIEVDRKYRSPKAGKKSSKRS